LEQKQKRVFDLVSIAAALARRHVPFKMTIIGSGSGEKELRQRIHASGIADRVHMTGTLSNAQVLENFAQQDVILLPSAYEGLPISLLEAMSRGCVPITSDLASGVPELICDGMNGFRVAVGDVDAFATRIQALQRQPELQSALSHGAFETVSSTYALETMVHAYARVFENIWQQIKNGSFARTGVIVPPSTLTLKERVMARVWSVSGRILRG
jgi:poly(glycerol-phosphate) alpha-glucosyltransferase